MQRFDFAEVLDWISVRVNLHPLGTVEGRLSHSEPKHSILKAKESHLIPSPTGDFTPPLCMLGRPGGSCMFRRTFTGPRRPAGISFYSPLMRNAANSLLATVTGHAGRCFFCDVGLQRAPPVGAWPSCYSYGVGFCQVWHEGSAGDHFLQFYV